MRFTPACVLSALFLSFSCIQTPVESEAERVTLELQDASDDEGEVSEAGSRKVPSMMEMMALGMPGAEHKELAKYAGEWEQQLSLWMGPGGGQPMQAKGRATNEMILGGRFLQTKGAASMMGMKTEQLSFLGFDRRHEKYITYGLDTMGTYGVAASGVVEEDGMLRLHGRDEEPWGAQVYHFEIEWMGPDKYRYSIYFKEMGGMTFDEPFKMVEVVNTRVAVESDDPSKAEEQDK